MRSAVAEDQMRSTGTDAITINACFRRNCQPRIGSKTEIIVGTECNVITAVDMDARALRRREQAP